MKIQNVVLLIVVVCLGVLAGCVGTDPATGARTLNKPLGTESVTAEEITTAITAGFRAAAAKTPEEKQEGILTLANGLMALLGLGTIKGIHSIGVDSGYKELKGVPAKPPVV